MSVWRSFGLVHVWLVGLQLTDLTTELSYDERYHEDDKLRQERSIIHE